MIRAVLCLSTLLVAGASSAAAQIIPIRTVPVSQGHQFEIFPSTTIAMGGISIAVADSLRDPFGNPATGVRLGATRFLSAPGAYSVSSDAGGGRTLPVAAVASRGDWFGGLLLALQEVDLSPRPDLSWLRPVCVTCADVGLDLGAAERTRGNSYSFAMLGKTLKPGLSVGGSIFWSRLNAVDGVDLLYAGSVRVRQHGQAFDARVGVLKEWNGGRSLEALVLHNRFNTTHDVFYLDPLWDPASRQVVQNPRLEKNLDRTYTWGLHLEYQQPISDDGWRAGTLFTVNRMDHPKIPNYEIMNIPRDPGHSSAFNAGVGVSRTVQGTIFGAEVIYEPIWSHTWADAATPIVNRLGQTIPAGGMTIENRFRFSNVLLRMGMRSELPLNETLTGGLQLGLAVHRISYRLDQHDHVQISDRRHEQRWTEWTPTWGLALRFPALEVRYRGSVTNGTGRPGVAGGGVVLDLRASSLAGANILAAPSGPLTLDEVRVTTHQVSLSLPLH